MENGIAQLDNAQQNVVLGVTHTIKHLMVNNMTFKVNVIMFLLKELLSLKVLTSQYRYFDFSCKTQTVNVSNFIECSMWLPRYGLL